MKRVEKDDIILDKNNQVYFDNSVGKFYILLKKGKTKYRFYIEVGGVRGLYLNQYPKIYE